MSFMNKRFVEKFDIKLSEKYYYTKHESGLDIYVFPKEMTLKTALLGVKFGGVYEDGASVDGKTVSFPSGIAHFLEHKLFSNENGIDAVEALAEVGADANAYTSNNKTVYMFSCTENFGKALEGLIGFVYHPYFTDENVESEKGIITQEIKMCCDSPYDAVSQNLLLALYGDCKLSDDVLGTEKTIKTITSADLFACYDSFYRYSNMVLVVCGSVDADEVLTTVDSCLPIREGKEAPTYTRIKTDKAVCSPYIERNMPVSMPVLEIGIKDAMPPANVIERLSRDVAMTILDEIIFSRAGELYNGMFESGLINESYTYGYSITSEVGFHSIYAESENPELVLATVKEYIKNVKKNGISEKDFVRCKRVMMVEYVRDFDSVDDIANSLLNLVFEGSDVFEYRRIIENVTLSDVEKCLSDSFDDECYALSVIKK